MSEYIENGNQITFHPGYYIKEIIDSMDLTQEDFAKRLGTTPKNLSLIVRGEQNLSVDMAMRLSRMLDTSVAYWQNLQNAYDVAEASIASDMELEEERRILKTLSYKYFRQHFNLPNLPRKIDEQVEQVRKFLGVSSLRVLCDINMAVNFRSGDNMDEDHIARANAMVQIAVNKTIECDAPKFNRSEFKKAVEYTLTQTTNHEGFYPLIQKAFFDAGVVLVLLPNLPGSKINGATKKVGSKIMLLVNDRRHNSDTFWFTLFHEIGHIMNGDFGISFESETGEREERANLFARDALIDSVAYGKFINSTNPHFTAQNIKWFADSIQRDPGIVLGRLQNDGYVSYGDRSLQSLRNKYTVKMGK